MLTAEGNINRLMEDVHKLWECQREQFKREKSLSEGHLLLLQLNSLPCILRVWKFCLVQFCIIVPVQIWTYWI